ncbi:MAG: hypothetical protein KGJ49_01845 [Alphaproteobacteria bacterium]|nr:hypothetical protein [Alphaproteobacteria bacterium]
MDNDAAGEVFTAIFMIAVIGLLWYAAWWRAKYRPPYVTDERGERQRVIKWSHGIPVYNPKTWQQRVHEETILASKRRWAILGSAPFVLGPIWLAYEAYTTGGNPWLGVAAAPLLLYGALPFGLLFFLPNVLKELLYQSGYQGMEGAKVLDRAPKAQPGRELVETQKAHGDAQLASEAEAVALLNSRK